MPAGLLDRIRGAAMDAADAPAARIAPADPIAVGWATVELDRAASELATELGIAEGSFVSADRSDVLGAACRIARGALAGGLSLVILEPDTEWRLAGALARSGEGPAVVWLATADQAAAAAALQRASIELAPPRGGPFGPERLVLGGPVHGPYRLLVGSAAGTIAG